MKELNNIDRFFKERTAYKISVKQSFERGEMTFEEMHEKTTKNISIAKAYVIGILHTCSNERVISYAENHINQFLGYVWMDRTPE